ncbi:AvrD family protein [Sphingobacterium hungaricum]
MDKESLFTEIDSFLGDHRERYFGSGFKNFSFDILNFSTMENELQGEIGIQYTGPSRPRKEVPHIGSIEFMAISLFICELGLTKLLGLSAREVTQSIPLFYSMRIKENICLADTFTTIKYTCLKESTRLDLSAVNIGISIFKISIGEALIELSIDHPGPTLVNIKKKSRWPPSDKAMHREGYKQRAIGLYDIKFNVKSEKITAKVDHPAPIPVRHQGISSSRNLVSPIDLLVSTGQLMQVLLYSILKTNRASCPNIWLRSMVISFEKPVLESLYLTSVLFKDRKQLSMHTKKWHLIVVHSQLTNMQAVFNICHELPNA